MTIDRQTATNHLGSVMSTYHRVYLNHKDADYIQANGNQEITRVIVRSRAALQRLAPLGSKYLEVLDKKYETPWSEMLTLAGAVEALQDDYFDNCLDSFRELLNADLFSDFLGMAEYLLQDENLKQPAVVLAGGVLEEHLRKLCTKHGVDTTVKDGKGKVKPKRADAMNADLRKANVYNQNDQKQVTAWCGIRNSAAHGKFDEFDETQAANMTLGIRTFISRFPA